MKFVKSILGLIFLLTFFQSCAFNLKAEPEIFIRFNQLGYLPNDIKIAVVLSETDLKGKSIYIYKSNSKEKISAIKFGKNFGTHGNFKFTYQIDFTNLQTKGEYYFQFGQQKSSAFKVNENIFNGIADSLLQFFKVQRCGYTNPFLHQVCHISDATKIIDGNNTFLKTIDVTGGWHDAGDYVKFLNTTSFATYMLLFAYDFDPVKFGFDNDKNNIPDILEEAKIGLDWMIRCLYNENKFVTQVQDLRDHDVGWRLPETDTLRFDRPAFVGVGKNLIGIYSAAMAIASRIWRDKIHYPEFAKQCLSTAEKIYSIRNNVTNVDSSGTGMYLDKNFEGKLALGAIELFITTGKSIYLNDATNYGDAAGPDFWWSWGNINSLAHYRIASYISRFKEYLEKNLTQFNKNHKQNLFGKATNPSWGTNVTLAGVALQNILYKKISGNTTFDSVSISQRDFILGKNPWGISFISGYGKNFTKNFHHQIAYYKKNLPGGFAAGPASKDFVDNAKITFEKSDKYFKFQSKEDFYRDDRMDYITNEPTISGNSTAIFVFGVLSSKK